MGVIRHSDAERSRSAADPEAGLERTLKGIPAAPGLAIGPAIALKQTSGAGGTSGTGEASPNPDASPEAEWTRFGQALQQARESLTQLEERTRRQVGETEAAVFEAHLLMLEDPELVERVQAAIKVGASAEQAVATAGEEMAAILAGLDDPYLQERALDVRDISRRLIAALRGEQEEELGGDAPFILLAEDLLPSQTARLDRSRVLGFATAAGGSTSHTAVLARSMGIPAVVGLGAGALDSIAEGARLILDGAEGRLIVDPSAETLARYQALLLQGEAEREALAALKHEPAQTADGCRIELGANIAGPQDLAAVLEAGAEGVGLFRTEFLFMERVEPPSEEEQYAIYREVAERLAPRPVIIRTLDAGGDKPIPYLGIGREENPFLGWRGIRYSLDQAELLRVQLRAVLRAAAHGRVRVMFPMITTLGEVRRARGLLTECEADLSAQGVPTGPVEVGIMLEVPAAALCADLLAPEVDFFSIGSNDLTQYTLAVDRGNRVVSHLYDPLHPAVLRLIHQVAEAAHRHGKWVGLCGEAGSHPDALPLLIGLGVDEISVAPPAVLRVKAQLRGLTGAECRERAMDHLYRMV